MLRTSCLSLAAVVVAALAAPAPAQQKAAIPDGKWFVSYSPTMSGEQRLAIVKSETKDGKTTFTTVFGGRSDWNVANAKIDGAKLSFDLAGPVKLNFEGVIDATNGKRLLGSLGDGRTLFQAALVATDKDEIGATDTIERAKLSDDTAEIQKLRSAPVIAANKARTEQDADKKKELQAEVVKLTKELNEKLPGLLKKAVKSETGTPAGYFVTMDLLGVAEKNNVKVDEVKAYTKDILAFAAKHGSRFEQETTIKVSETLAGQTSLAPVAMDMLDKAIKANEKAPVTLQLRLMKALALAQEKSGKTSEAKATLEKLDKLDSAADVEYKKTVPPFTPEKYAGRKNAKANKVAVMELFTGAQCPPCVAADVGFDALEKSYLPKDLVLIQYHMHIPGPDPLTNLDSIARWDFYRDKFAASVRGTPTTLFNGKVKAGGGGGMANAKKKYDEYSEIINEILEETSPYTLSGSASLTGDKVSATIKVESTTKPDGDQMLRVLLVEDEVRYVGGNGLRLHHQVVRSQFGKKDGVAVKELKDGKFEVSVSLDSIRKDLTKYLDEFASQRPFPNSDRPMAMKKLHVIALIQDDTTGEIAQAVQLSVSSK